MIIPFWGPRICREIPPPRLHRGGADRVLYGALRSACAPQIFALVRSAYPSLDSLQCKIPADPNESVDPGVLGPRGLTLYTNVFAGSTVCAAPARCFPSVFESILILGFLFFQVASSYSHVELVRVFLPIGLSCYATVGLTKFCDPVLNKLLLTCLMCGLCMCNYCFIKMEPVLNQICAYFEMLFQ